MITGIDVNDIVRYVKKGNGIDAMIQDCVTSIFINVNNGEHVIKMHDAEFYVDLQGNVYFDDFEIIDVWTQEQVTIDGKIEVVFRKKEPNFKTYLFYKKPTDDDVITLPKYVV